MHTNSVKSLQSFFLWAFSAECECRIWRDRVRGLTQRDLRLHGHGQSWVVDLAAEQSLVIQLGVEAPGQHGSHLHGAVVRWLLLVLEVVEGVAALDPAGELPAHNCLRDHLCSRPGARLRCLISVQLRSTGAVLAQPSRLPLFFQQGQGLLEFGVIKLSAGENLGPPHPRLAPAPNHFLVAGFILVSCCCGKLGSWHDVDKLSISFEVHLKCRDELRSSGSKIMHQKS